ncbi:hypothetical protein [Agarilytica rhodophyticola]|uniref:hypothetical protein n=1 Tax=Agarilytica rhodophyticola TaxID=1737490 RepID=UPI000B34805C|nr:hypothetical protein [Agarilytica rhodophyticola]
MVGLISGRVNSGGLISQGISAFRAGQQIADRPRQMRIQEEQRQRQNELQDQQAQLNDQRIQLNKMTFRNEKLARLKQEGMEAMRLFEATGQLPERETYQKFVDADMARFSVWHYEDPEKFKTALEFGPVLAEMSQGRMEAANSPRAIELVNREFADQIKKGIGEIHPQTGRKIVDKNIVRFDARAGGVVPILGVTLDNGDVYEVERTMRRSADPNDPVEILDAGVLMDDIMARYQLAQMATNPEFQRKIKGAIQALDARSQQSDSVQSSKIIGGLTLMTTRGGNVVVKDVTGKVLQGEAAQKALEKAFKTEVDFKGAKERAKGQAKLSVDVVEKSFESIGKVRTNITNIDRAIDALDRGARTGAVDRFLPSITAASRELDQIRNELGLDVVGSVTFGALSEGELNLALDTALPTGLDEPQLKDYLLRKKEAQEKVLANLQEAALFLSRDGATVADFIRFKNPNAQQPQQTEIQQQPAQSAPTQPSQTNNRGWQLMTDAQGNQAYVSPDGTQFEELN